MADVQGDVMRSLLRITSEIRDGLLCKDVGRLRVGVSRLFNALELVDDAHLFTELQNTLEEIEEDIDSYQLDCQETVQDPIIHKTILEHLDVLTSLAEEQLDEAPIAADVEEAQRKMPLLRTKSSGIIPRPTNGPELSQSLSKDSISSVESSSDARPGQGSVTLSGSEVLRLKEKYTKLKIMLRYSEKRVKMLEKEKDASDERKYRAERQTVECLKDLGHLKAELESMKAERTIYEERIRKAEQGICFCVDETCTIL